MKIRVTYDLELPDDSQLLAIINNICPLGHAGATGTFSNWSVVEVKE